MKKFNITIDSSCDVNEDELVKLNIKEIYFKCVGSDNSILYKVNSKEFFDNMKNGISYKTSQINPIEYYEFFKEVYKEKLPIIHISLGSGLSNTINSAFMGINMLHDEDCNIDIRPLDSKIASLGLKILLDKAILLQNEGKTIDEAMDVLSNIIPNLNTYYTTDTLSYFVAGGRISKVKGFIGSALKINPILDCNPDGGLRVIDNVRGVNKTFDNILERVKNTVVDPSNQTLYVAHSDRYDDAILLANKINNELHFKNIVYYPFGPIIGSHTGPGLISIFYLGKKRVEQVSSVNTSKDELKDEIEKLLAK